MEESLTSYSLSEGEGIMLDVSEALSIDVIQKTDASANFLVCGRTIASPVIVS
jgi:hypothetical protein